MEYGGVRYRGIYNSYYNSGYSIFSIISYACPWGRRYQIIFRNQQCLYLSTIILLYCGVVPGRSGSGAFKNRRFQKTAGPYLIFHSLCDRCDKGKKDYSVSVYLWAQRGDNSVFRSNFAGVSNQSGGLSLRKINLIILEEEEEYARKLALGIRRREGGKLEAVWYGDRESFLAAEKEADLILLGEEFQEKEFIENLVMAGGSKRVALLAQEYIKRELTGYPVILKFQSLEQIISGIYRVAAQNEKDDIVRPGMKKEIIGVYAPWSYEISVLFSSLMSRILAEEKRLLYVSLAEGCFGARQEEDLADLISFLRAGRGNAQTRLRSILRKNGKVHYLPAMGNPQNIWDMSGEDYERLWTALYEDPDHDAVLFEFGAAYEGVYEDMDRCVKIYCPYQEVFRDGPQRQIGDRKSVV